MQRILPSRPNAYTGGALQRATHLREDEAWLLAARQAPEARFVLFRRGKTLIDDSAGTLRARLSPHADAAAPWVFIGLADAVPLFAADVSATAAEDGFVEMRGVAGALPGDRCGGAWRRRAACCTGGRRTSSAAFAAGPTCRCAAATCCAAKHCGTQHFPRSDPAVIMLVVRGERLLLGQSQKFPGGAQHVFHPRRLRRTG